MSPLGRACREFIVDSLKKHDLPCNEQAICLLSMIAAHESCGFKYTRQMRGSAVTHFQIEPNTYTDLVIYQKKRGLNLPDPPAEYLVFYPDLAAAYARVFFLRYREPLPDADNLRAMSEYAKLKWNTRLGKATPDDYLNAYMEYFG